MKNNLFLLVNIVLYLSVIFILFRTGGVAFFQKKKALKLKYFLPFLIYILLTTIFAPQIISFLSPCKIPAFYGPIGDGIVYLIYPDINIVFFVLYFFTILATLVYWEPVVKYSESAPYVGPLLAFVIVCLTNLFISGAGLDPKVAKPLLCWLAFMACTLLIGAWTTVRDLKKQFAKELRKKDQKKPVAAVTGKKKLLLIYPVDELIAGLTVRTYSTMPPLSMAILSALTPKDQFQVSLIDEQFEVFSYQEADLVAITAFTAYAPRAYKIAAVYRKKGIPVVMGGIHASMRTEEALQFVDSVVVGEAENIWPAVLQNFLEGELKQIYQGTYSDLKNMVVPDRSIFDGRYMVTSIQTSRGCPWNCKYCSVTAFNGRRYRQRPVEEILDELETIPNRYIFFIDDNLIGYSRKSEARALAIFKGMVERKIKKRWITQTTVDIGTKPELLKWAAKSGCLLLFLGLEFIDYEELKQMDKEFALKVDYTQALKNINRAGIGVIGAFIYGSDEDTEEKMLKRAAFVKRGPVDAMQQSKLTAFPGTRIFKALQEENRILYTNYPEDWEKYNFYELTHTPRRMQRDAFLRAFRRCVSETYAYRTIWVKALRTLWHTKRFEVATAAMRLNLSYRILSLYHIRNQIDQETAVSRHRSAIETEAGYAGALSSPGRRDG